MERYYLYFYIQIQLSCMLFPHHSSPYYHNTSQLRTGKKKWTWENFHVWREPCWIQKAHKGLITPNWTQRLSTSHVISLFVRSFLFVVLQLRCSQHNKQNIRWAVHEHAVTSPHSKLAHQKDQAVNHSIEVYLYHYHRTIYQGRVSTIVVDVCWLCWLSPFNLPSI